MSLENLDEKLKWVLYRGMVSDALVKAGYKGCPWAFSEPLDMSFEDISIIPIEHWQAVNDYDLMQYRAANPHEFK